MALFRGSYSVEQIEADRTRRESGERSLRVVDRVSPVEKVEGAFSFPDSIKRDVRFRTGQNGELILRIYDDAGWRDAKVTDLAPVEVDLLARRDRARARANTHGSGIGARTAQSQDDRRRVPKFIGPHERPRDRSVTAVIAANFFVTDGIRYVTDSPLFDHGDPMGSLVARAARVNQLMKTGAA